MGRDHRVISLTEEHHYGPILRDSGIQVDCLRLTPRRPGPVGMAKLVHLIRRDRPSLIQGWMYHGNLAAALAAKVAPGRPALSWNIRLALEVGGGMKRSTALAVKAGALLSGGPDAIIYNSRRSCSQHEARGYRPESSIIIPNGFDTTRWQPDNSARRRLADELQINDRSRFVGFVGRGHAQKDLPNLFDAFGKVAAVVPDVVLVCLGRELEKWLPADIPRGKVRFLGQRPDVEAILPAFDLLCLSSRNEGFPNVIGEAMACGVPCVTTDVGDAAAIVGDTGWVVPPQDSDALAAALRSALAASPSELDERARSARAIIEARYSLRSVIAAYNELYDRLGGLADARK